jgi:phosphate-selective porin OprO/OprP
MSLKLLLTAGVAASALLLTTGAADAQQRQRQAAPQAAPAPAAQPIDQLRLLQTQIDDLRKELYDLETKYANTNTEFTRFPLIELSNGRPIFRSRDRAFEFRMEGRMHFDWAHYDQDAGGTPDLRPAGVNDLNSGTNFRRIRLGAFGKFANEWEFALVGEWGGSAEASTLDEVSLAYTGFAPFVVRVGAFKPGSNMDDQTSSNDIKFIERASAANINSSFAAGTARKGIEVLASDNTFYMARIALTGETYGNAEGADEQMNVTGRVSIRPSTSADHDIHVGAGAAFIIDPAQVQTAATTSLRQSFRLRDRPELRVDADRLIDTGDVAIDNANTFGIELAGRWKNFAVQAEHFWYKLGRRNIGGPALSDVDFKGWYVQGAWVITGEPQRYRVDRGAFQSPQPRANFKAGGDPGAWEAVARYSVVDLDDAPATGAITAAQGIRGGEQKIITLGVNWYLNRNVRFMFNWLNVDVDRLNTAGAQIGQEYDAFAVRSQFNF